MALLVDQAHWPWRDRLWCHLVSDTSLDELHSFAARLGIPERGFQGDHYDLPHDLRVQAIEHGAQEVSSREIILALRAAGLRRR
ncbi:MAG: DUF4031 domain-containing protein [Actinomycetota bacterium]|nr:DUF4031 domain-containing protein [Actinomycetota bacterium]MDP2288832.1 DUF4031 domain-containing protein [Actinomycetota bacterium]